MTQIDQSNAWILRELRSDGRISNLALAEKIWLSPSSCLHRVQDLERRGVITGYRRALIPFKPNKPMWCMSRWGWPNIQRRHNLGSNVQWIGLTKSRNATTLLVPLNICCGSKRQIWWPIKRFY